MHTVFKIQTSRQAVPDALCTTLVLLYIRRNLFSLGRYAVFWIHECTRMLLNALYIFQSNCFWVSIALNWQWRTFWIFFEVLYVSSRRFCYEKDRKGAITRLASLALLYRQWQRFMFFTTVFHGKDSQSAITCSQCYVSRFRREAENQRTVADTGAIWRRLLIKKETSNARVHPRARANTAIRRMQPKSLMRRNPSNLNSWRQTRIQNGTL